jgi:hypothetical protein
MAATRFTSPVVTFDTPALKRSGQSRPSWFKAGISKVTAADVQRVAAVYMDSATFSSVTVKK